MHRLEIKINEEYSRLLPPLPPAEYEALKESIRIHGLLNPIEVNPEGYILDGVHRYRACVELGIEPKYTIKRFDDPLEEKRFVIESNLIRRQLTKFQRIEAALPLIEIERKLAEKRKKAGKPLKDLDPNLEQGRTLEIVAKKIGVSHGLLGMALWLIENAPEEELDKLRKGEKSIYRAYMELKNRLNAASSIRRKARIRKLLEFFKPPREKLLTVSNYRNTDRMHIIVEKPLREEISEVTEKLDVEPETFLQKTIEKHLRELRKLKPEEIEALRKELKSAPGYRERTILTAS